MRETTFHDYVVHDLLGEARGVTSRAMFGGWAVYRDGVIFGIIVDGELYFKVDDTNRAAFERLDSHPFVYAKKDGTPVTMSYWLVPQDVMDDRERLHELMEQSLAASRNKS